MTVSSAYFNTLEACQQLGRSVTYNEDSNRPSIEPRGTPQTTCWRLDRTPPTKTDGCGQLGNQTSKDVHYPKSQTTAAYQILWSIASNALQKSTKMASVRSSAIHASSNGVSKESNSCLCRVLTTESALVS